MQPNTVNTIIREMMTCRSISDMCDEITRQINSYIQKLGGELNIEYDTASNTNKVYYIHPSDGKLKKFTFKSNIVFLNWLIGVVESEERMNKMNEEYTKPNKLDECSTAKTSDMVNHPPHYMSERGIECMTAIKACVDGYVATPTIGWLAGQIIKYLWRAPFKGHFYQDLRKANYYMQEIMKEIEGHDT